MTQPVPQQSQDSAPPDSGPLGPTGVHILKIAVVVMGLMILAGFAAIIWRIIYLANTSPRQAPAAAIARTAPNAQLALPGGAIVRQISLSGDRLAVHFEGPSGAGVALLDVASGRMISRVDIVPEIPR